MKKIAFVFTIIKYQGPTPYKIMDRSMGSKYFWLAVQSSSDVDPVIASDIRLRGHFTS